MRLVCRRLLRDLMTVVTVEDVNQENICCLNTGPSVRLRVRACVHVCVYVRVRACMRVMSAT